MNLMTIIRLLACVGPFLVFSAAAPTVPGQSKDCVSTNTTTGNSRGSCLRSGKDCLEPFTYCGFDGMCYRPAELEHELDCFIGDRTGRVDCLMNGTPCPHERQVCGFDGLCYFPEEIKCLSPFNPDEFKTHGTCRWGIRECKEPHKYCTDKRICLGPYETPVWAPYILG